jgi:hypothetical protein
MRTAHALGGPARAAGLELRRIPHQAVWLVAHLRARRLDRQLGEGAVSWCSQIHAARAVQLTGDRHRRGLARSLERLVENAEDPTARFISAVIPPCREQVREAMPLLLTVASRLRSAEPVDARGVARLRALLADGSGPCYMPSRPDALTIALQSISRSLDVEG